MNSLHTITSLSQGKLHDNHEALWTEAVAQHDALADVFRLTVLRRFVHSFGEALAGAGKLRSLINARIHAAH